MAVEGLTGTSLMVQDTEVEEAEPIDQADPCKAAHLLTPVTGMASMGITLQNAQTRLCSTKGIICEHTHTLKDPKLVGDVNEAKITINNIGTVALLDTGSCVSFVRKHFIKTIYLILR